MKDLEILKLVEAVGLTKTVMFVLSYVKKVVLEFYANLSIDMRDVTSDNAFLAYIHGNVFVFSPNEITF